MSKAVKYTCSIFIIITVFTIGNYFCYRSAMKHFENMQKEEATKITQQMQGMSKEFNSKYNELEEKSNSISAGTKESKTVNIQTIYQIENYNTVKGTISTDYKTIPEELVGMTRKQVDNYCKKYIRNMPTDEYLAGLESMGVTQFSENKLIVRKIYDSSKIKYRYYIIEVEGEVVVYYGDKKTVYEYTGIRTSSLSKDEKNKLKNGIEVKDENELFGILENYSS